MVTASQLLTQQTKGDHVKRHRLKWFLARELYTRKWEKQRIVDLFNIIDWMMQIPPVLQARLMRDVAKLERKKGMTYMSSFERAGLERGRREALSELVGKLLAKRFGVLPSAVKDQLKKATPAQLEAWGELVVDAPTLDSVFARSWKEKPA